MPDGAVKHGLANCLRPHVSPSSGHEVIAEVPPCRKAEQAAAINNRSKEILIGISAVSCQMLSTHAAHRKSTATSGKRMLSSISATKRSGRAPVGAKQTPKVCLSSR